MKKLIFTVASTLLFFSITLGMPQADTAQNTKEMPTGQEKNLETVNLMEVITICNESFRTDMSYLKALNDSGSFPDETDGTPKCYVRCFLTKTGVVTDKGTFNPEIAAMVFSGYRGGKLMNNVEDLAKTCSTNRDEKCQCERAYQFLKCLMEKEIEEYEKTP